MKYIANSLKMAFPLPPFMKEKKTVKNRRNISIRTIITNFGFTSSYKNRIKIRKRNTDFSLKQN